MSILLIPGRSDPLNGFGVSTGLSILSTGDPVRVRTLGVFFKDPQGKTEDPG